MKTIQSEETPAPIHDMLDHVTAGDEVVIEQNHKPVAVLIPYARWRRLKQLQREEFDRIRKEMDAGHYFTMEQVDEMLKRDGILS